jgi:crossover junction endodeoxyribonuclease RuvC
VKVLGIDPGFGRLGYAVVERQGSVFSSDVYGVVETDKSLPLPARLEQIYERILEIVSRCEPECIATEAVLFAANRTTALDVTKALGVVLLAAAKARLSWAEYTPPQVKSAVTGSGKADKKQVQFMVMRMLNLGEVPKPDDVTDALAIGICHALCARPNIG